MLQEYPIQQAYNDAVEYGMSLAINKAKLSRLPKIQVGHGLSPGQSKHNS